MFVTHWESSSSEDEEEVVNEVVNEVEPQELSQLQDYTFQLPATITVSGQSGAGKSVLTKAFLEQNRSHFDRVIVVSGSAHFNHEYDDLVRNPKRDIFEPNETDKLERVVKLQEQIKKKGRIYRLALVLDNFLGSNLKLHHSGLFDKLASMGRHINVTTIILSQRVHKLSTTIRDNTHYWLVTKLNHNDFDCLFPYQTQHKSRSEFWNQYQQGTKERYSFMLIQNRDAYSQNIHFFKGV